MIGKFLISTMLILLTLPAFSTEYIVQTEKDQVLKLTESYKKIASDIYLVKSNNKFAKANLLFANGVKRVEENRPIYLLDEEEDPDRDRSKEQWALYGEHGVNAKEAWKIEEGSDDIVIAIIDTGIDYNHKELKDVIWINEKEANGEPGVDDDENGYIDDIHGYDFKNDDSDPMDDHNHGTHCAGIIAAAHDGVGTNGIMKHVKLMPVKFLDSKGGTTAGAIASIKYATMMGVDIMSNSWGGGGYSEILEDAIKEAEEAGIVFVAAAGNESNNNDEEPSYPCTYEVDNVISVAAHKEDGNIAWFSNYGETSVHVSAPGYKILSTIIGDKYESFSGTSMATPYVSGIVGLMLSKNKNLTPIEVRQILIDSSTQEDVMEGKTISNGIVNAAKALESI